MKQDFKQWGQEGGLKRAEKLSRARRQEIARQAAQARWGKQESELQSVRLEQIDWVDPIFLEEVLLFGGINEWRELRKRIANRPFGAESLALEKVLETNQIYGATSLWEKLLKKYRGA